MTHPAFSHVLITGASSGIGSALARHIAPQAQRLTLLGRDTARLAAVARMCERAGGAAISTVSCDVRDAGAMQAILLAADDSMPLGTVIANAGIGGAEVLTRDGIEPADLARRIVDTNLTGTINTVAPLQARFIARRAGCFVVVASMAAYEGLAEAPTYAASKAAVRIYGHGLRRLLSPHGVAVTVVTPGFVATPMSDTLPFARPFLWTADHAALRIVKGVLRREPEVAFPWQLALAAGIGRHLPVRLVDRLLALGRSRLGPSR